MEQKRKAIAADAINRISSDVDCANIVVRMEDVAEIIVEAQWSLRPCRQTYWM